MIWIDHGDITQNLFIKSYKLNDILRIVYVDFPKGEDSGQWTLPVFSSEKLSHTFHIHC
jgi:hypothetical protein